MASAAFWLDLIGLGLAFIGGLMLLFGAPQIIDTGGRTIIVEDAIDESELRKERRYKLWSRIGLAMLVLAFFCQFVAKVVSP